MNFVQCAACSKPVHPKATQCRWCGAEVKKDDAEKAADGVTPAIVKEAGELRGWAPGPSKAPALFSPLTWILAVLVAAALAVDITQQAVLMRWMSARFLNVVMVPLLFWSAVMRDWSVHRSRLCATPEDAVQYYFNRIARRLYGQARRALADHPTAATRHAKLRAQIRQWGDLEVNRVNIHKVEILGKDMAVVEADVVLRTVSHLVVPLPGLIYSRTTTQDSDRASSKLLVARNGRWYLVNGLLTDRIDRNLIKCLSEGGAT